MLKANNAVQISSALAGGKDVRKFLKIKEPLSKRATGDNFEYQCAASVLAHGIKSVHRGVELRPKTGANIHSEFDLVFNWKGKLWLVDCKDRKPESRLVKGFRSMCKSLDIPENAQRKLSEIQGRLKASAIQMIKEDIAAISEIGGLLGQVVCARRSMPSDETVVAFAKSHRVLFARKSTLYQDFKDILGEGKSPV